MQSKIFVVICLHLFVTEIFSSSTVLIANGIPAPQGLAPYHAHILIRENSGSINTWVGSGALITTRHVLTTAANVRGFGWWNIGLGSIIRDELQWFETMSATIHPEFNYTTLLNNLAIIETPSEIQTSPQISPVNMPSIDLSSLPLVNQFGRVTGFGFTAPGENFANVLKVGLQTVTNIESCVQVFEPISNYVDSAFCSVSDNGSLCAGDQGAGFVMDVLTPMLVGIASFSTSSCSSVMPDSYIRVNYYRDWIQSVTGTIW